MKLKNMFYDILYNLNTRKDMLCKSEFYDKSSRSIHQGKESIRTKYRIVRILNTL